MEQRDFNERLRKLEEDRDGIVENEKLLLRLARYHRAGLQELNGKAEKIELTQGDTNERLDGIEQTLKEQGKRFGDVEYQVKDLHTKINAQHRQSEARLDALDGKMDQIIALLQKGGE
jgi:hypothetical protein